MYFFFFFFSCRRDSRLELSIPGLAFPLVPHTCVSVLGYHWFRWWLVACSAPSHCLNQCCLFVNRTLGNKFQWNSNLNAIHSIQNMHSIMLSILAAFLSGPLCVKAAPHDRTSYFIRCRTLNSEAHVSLFYYGCEHTRDWYGSLQGRFPHNGLFILLLCIYYDLCLAPCTFTVNKLLLLLLLSPKQIISPCLTEFFFWKSLVKILAWCWIGSKPWSKLALNNDQWGPTKW